MQAILARPGTLMYANTRCVLNRWSSGWSRTSLLGGGGTKSVGRAGAGAVWMGREVQDFGMRRNGVTCAMIRSDTENQVAVADLGCCKPSSLVVVSFYKFADLPDYADMRMPLRELCEAHRVSGGIILAPEGINGSICGTRESLDKVFAFVESDERFKNLRKTEAPATREDEDIHDGHSKSSPLGAGDDAPFRWGHVRIKLKNEVVPLGVPGVKPSQKVGKYVKPKDWNALISDADTVTIDVRNDYEIRIGKFKGAVDPETQAFREFPAWVEDRFGLREAKSEDFSKDHMTEVSHQLSPGVSSCKDINNSHSTSQPKRIAMYCTGGIRCEKATSYFIEKGFHEVYHLEGGILRYLEEVPAERSLWEGECFVFDKRVSVEHGLKQGSHTLCYGCKKPVNDQDKKHPLWEEGVSCAYCFHSKTDEERARARARQEQSRLFGVIGGPDRGKRPSQKKQGSQS
ncbi:hypothetical protein Mapa_011373 [Marchantia paleacea]|nr:hypothetical protein Mapa_011373 [Marchantia paleacea]